MSQRIFTRWDLWTAILPLIAVLPMLVFRSEALWSDVGMRFFPAPLSLVLLIVLYHLGRNSQTTNRARQWTAIGVFLSAVLIYCVSVWQFSPYLAHFAAILGFVGWGLGRFGQTHWAVVCSWAGLLATTLGLPYNWNPLFEQWLQLNATWCCSMSLDAFSIPNLRLGNLIELREQHMFTEQICGGLGSLLALAAVTIAILILRRRGALTAVISLAMLPVWMQLCHYLRLMSVAIAAEYWKRDLATGLDFRLLEITTFCIVVVFSFLLIRMLATLFEPVPVANAEFGPVFSGLNKAICWPQPDPFENAEPEDADDRKHFLQLKASREAALLAAPTIDWTQESSPRWIVMIASIVLLLVSVMPTVVLARSFRSLRFGSPEISLATIENLSKTPIPDDLGDWKLVDSTRVATFSADGQGTQSLVWEFRSSDQTISLSVDFAFIGWSNPTTQRSLIGWEIGRQVVDATDRDWPILTADLRNDLGGLAIVFSSMLDDQLDPYLTVDEVGLADEKIQVSRQWIGSLMTGEIRKTKETTLRIQLFCESGEPLTRSERNEFEANYIKLRKMFVRKKSQ